MAGLALPIDAHLPAVVAALRAHRAAVLIAAPGAGKTTRVPPALADDGAVIVLQPRRVAARALARRVAEERDWTLGREVGWHVRDDLRATAATRVLFATEGILTARAQQDPLLSGFTTIVLDEFHERTIHGDLGLALARQAWLARDDLRLLVMSATLSSDAIVAYLDGCPVVQVPGAAHPVDVRYRPEADVVAGIREALDHSSGDVLAFLPGAREIDEARQRVARDMPGVDVLPLHGGLSADAQDAIMQPGANRRVVLATNIAETSLTVPRVRAVVDAGQQKVARYDAERGLDRLVTERITADAADQRAGRAGRLGSGLVIRLWHAQDRLRPFRQPEIARVDLAPLLLAVLAWGLPDEVTWLEPPDAARLATARALLERLGLVAPGGRLTGAGRQAQRLAVHPRLARLLIDTGGARTACLAAAALSELRDLRGDGVATSCDLWSLVTHETRLPRAVIAAADGLARRLGSTRQQSVTEREFRRAVLAAFPDRVARRRDATGSRVQLATGTGGVLTRDSGVQAPWLVAISARSADGPDARIAMATAIDKAWLSATSRDVGVAVDDAGVVSAVETTRYDALVLHEQAVTPDEGAASEALAAAWATRPHDAATARLLARLRFAGLDVDVGELVRTAATGCRRLDDIDLARALPWPVSRELDRLAPERLAVPSGRTTRLDYRGPEDVVAAVKLQELFGLADSPRLGPRQVPVLFELLAPNGRPVQTTRDLRSFWSTTYQDVRKELRARYPKHPWPEDPWNATPTHRTGRDGSPRRPGR